MRWGPGGAGTGSRENTGATKQSSPRCCLLQSLSSPWACCRLQRSLCGYRASCASCVPRCGGVKGSSRTKARMMATDRRCRPPQPVLRWASLVPRPPPSPPPLRHSVPTGWMRHSTERQQGALVSECGRDDSCLRWLALLVPLPLLNSRTGLARLLKGFARRSSRSSPPCRPSLSPQSQLRPIRGREMLLLLQSRRSAARY
mmetsp:Transcript_26757/g.61656  ORF Transcript_26757/g.61656 Transcript_26757/m.61656 type:complete len:201 (-) Transcript_26757:1223-1825(-)